MSHLVSVFHHPIHQCQHHCTAGDDRHHRVGGLDARLLLPRPGAQSGTKTVQAVQTAGGAAGLGPVVCSSVPQVTWLGRYRAGVPAGPAWQWSEGGGWLVGSLQPTVVCIIQYFC